MPNVQELLSGGFWVARFPYHRRLRLDGLFPNHSGLRVWSQPQTRRRCCQATQPCGRGLYVQRSRVCGIHLTRPIVCMRDEASKYKGGSHRAFDLKDPGVVMTSNFTVPQKGESKQGDPTNKSTEKSCLSHSKVTVFRIPLFGPPFWGTAIIVESGRTLMIIIIIMIML